jgi:ABC-type amino acid transport system permease subunit
MTAAKCIGIGHQVGATAAIMPAAMTTIMPTSVTTVTNAAKSSQGGAG